MNTVFRFFYFVLCTSTFLFFTSTANVFATDERTTDIKVFHQNAKGKTSSKEKIFRVKDFGTNGASSIALCNLYGNRIDEIVVGSGPGEEPMVKILKQKRKNKTGEKKWHVVKRFQPYASDMTAGVRVACGKVFKGDRPHIVTAPGVGAGPEVKVFSRTGRTVKSFFAFDRDFHGGVSIAVGDVKKNQRARIIAASGRGEETRVRMFRVKNGGTIIRELQLLPFASGHQGGGNVATGDVDGDNRDEIIVSVAGFSNGVIKVYNPNKKKTVLGEFTAYSTDFTGGVNIAAADINNDGKEEIVAAPAQRGGPDVRAYTAEGKRIGQNFYAYESEFRGGTMLAASENVDYDRKAEIVTVPQKNTITGRAQWQKYIEVDLSTQTLTAWENGMIKKQFLISSGLAPNVTPTGEFEIMRHVLNMTYSWPYAPGHPGNEYDLPNVPYNMEFTRYFYFHNSWWHNNYGNPMSHGCVNIDLENSKWLYYWAEDGDAVWVHQ